MSIQVDKQQFNELLLKKRELTDAQIEEMLKTIKPTVRQEDGLYYIESVDARNTDFTYRPTFAERAQRLTEVARILTLHSFAYVGLFKPTIAEVLSMIPESLIGEVKAFETVGPENSLDLHDQQVAGDASYHVAMTVLYNRL